MRSQLFAAAAILIACCLSGCCSTCGPVGCGSGYGGGLMADLNSCDNPRPCEAPGYLNMPRGMNLCADGSGRCGGRGCGLLGGCGLFGGGCGGHGGCGLLGGGCGSGYGGGCNTGCGGGGCFLPGAGLLCGGLLGGGCGDGCGGGCCGLFGGCGSDCGNGCGGGCGFGGGCGCGNDCGGNCGIGGAGHGGARLAARGCGRPGCGLGGRLCDNCRHPYSGVKPHTRDFTGDTGSPTPQYAYPYYTTRGPRDFLVNEPPTIGW